MNKGALKKWAAYFLHLVADHIGGEAKGLSRPAGIAASALDVLLQVRENIDNGEETNHTQGDNR